MFHEDGYLRPVPELTNSSGKSGYLDYTCTLCGKVKNCIISQVSRLTIKSCGCIRSLKPDNPDLQGNEINGILFIGYIKNSKWKILYKCGCSGIMTKFTAEHAKTGSCKICYDKYEKIPTTTHGYAGRDKSNSTYGSWLNMRRRCRDPNNNRYEYYGEKGITVCQEWLNSFESFLRDMGDCPEGMSLERKDLNFGYNKDNCKWATDKEQANNKTNNILISNGNESMSLKHWCAVEGIDYKNAHHRFKKNGESIESILGINYTLVSCRYR